MNKFLLAAAAVSVVGMTITGCSKDEVLSNRKTSESNVIGFHLNGSKAPLSRALPIDDNNLKTAPFDVFAYTTTDGIPFMGFPNSTDLAQPNHDGVEIQWSEDDGAWVYANKDEQAYWPSEALDFYAISPVDNTSINWLIKHDSQIMSYQWGDEFKSSSHKNVDLMYASTPNMTKPTDGTVKMTFKHTLSQVLFKAKKEVKSMEVEIGNVYINNMRVGGTFTFPAADQEPALSNWNTNQEMTALDKNEFLTHPSRTTPVALSWDDVNGVAVSTMLSTETDVMMPVPQKLIKWSTAVGAPKTTAEAKTAGESYLRIECKIKQGGVYYVGDADNLGSIYVPFEATWEPGKRYIYTLVFGGGYKADGTPILDPIKITADQEDWKSPDVESDVTM